MNSKLRVAVLIDNINHRNGVSLFCVDFIKWLIDMKINVKLFATCSSKESTNYLLIDSSFLCLYSRSIRTPIPFYPELPILIPYNKILKELNQFNPNIIHFETPGPMGIVSKKYFNKNNCFITSFYHTHFPSLLEIYFTNINKFLSKIAFNTCSLYQKFLFNNLSIVYKYNTVELPSYISEQKFCNLPFGINNYFNDENVFENKFPNKSKFDKLIKRKKKSYKLVLLFVGRFFPEKNIEMLLKIVRKRKDICLLFAGEGPLENKILNTPHITNLGFLDINSLKYIYKQVDAFILPSFNDTFGRVVLESIACKTPVMLSYNVGIVKTLKDKDDYIGFSPTSFESLNKAIDKILKDRAILDNCATNAYNKLKPKSYNNTFSVIVNEWENLIK